LTFELFDQWRSAVLWKLLPRLSESDVTTRGAVAQARIQLYAEQAAFSP